MEKKRHSIDKVDAMIIDNECSCLTKRQAQLTALQFFYKEEDMIVQLLSGLNEHEHPKEFLSLSKKLHFYRYIAIERAYELGLTK